MGTAVREFRSKADAWLVALVVVAVLGTVAATVPLLLAGAGTERAVAAVTLIGGVGLMAWLFLGTKYVITATELVIVSGPFRWRIALADIVGVEPTHNPLASPALSLDRLAIRYGDGRVVMISPADRDAFLSALGWKADGASA